MNKMELKTLKDIKPYIQGTSLAEFDLMKDKLKEEAIKWIKELDSDLLTVANGLPLTVEGSESYIVKKTNKSALILWIKHFFNVTNKEKNDE